MKRVSIACLILLLAGCASYTAEPIIPPAQQNALESRRLEAPEVKQFFERVLGHRIAAWPPKYWDLNTLTLAAFYYHPDLDQAQARRLVAEAAIITAGGRPNPTAGVSLQHSQNPPAGTSPWTNSLNLEFPVETAGKRSYRIDQATYLAHAAKLREAETVWRVRSRVRADLLAAYPTETLVRRQRDLQEQITRMLQRRFAVGYASRPELTQAHLALNQAMFNLQANQKQAAENLARLATAVGVPIAAVREEKISYDMFEKLPPVSALPPAKVRSEALLSRPDLLAALADYEASQSALQLAIAEQYPDISLGPGYTWDQGQVKWSLGFSLVLPLLNRNEGPIAEAKARREGAAAAFLAAQAKAIAEVDEALANYGHAIQMLETADSLLRDQQKNERAITAGYKAGEADQLAWLSAQYQTVTAELTRIDALSQAQQSLGHLEDALRRPIGPNVLAVTAQQIIASKSREDGEHP